MSDVEVLSYYLGIEVRQEKEALTLGQSAYASKLLEQSGMAVCKPCVTPMEERLKLMKASSAAKVDATLYQSINDGMCYLGHKEDLVIDVYVDDLIVTGARTKDINSFKREMAAHFQMSDLGALSYYLGIEVR